MSEQSPARQDQPRTVEPYDFDQAESPYFNPRRLGMNAHVNPVVFSGDFRERLPDGDPDKISQEEAQASRRSAAAELDDIGETLIRLTEEATQ